jgi:hypothetical protein
MLKLLSLAIVLLLPGSLWAGGSEVPWPEVIQREVFIKDLQGVWVSKTLNSPQRIFEIKVQVADFDLTCPYVVTLTEISPFTGKAVSKDIDVFCTSFPRKVIFVLNDEQGQARKQVEIVGILKDKEQTELGSQYLGITVYNYGEMKEKVYQDIFYKLSP